VTGSPIEPLSPEHSWIALKRRADRVGRELVSIRDPGSRGRFGGESGAMAGSEATPGGPMTGTTQPRLVPSPEPFFSTSLIYPFRNAWVASDHRRFLAVEAGADPVHPSTGVLGILRQNYLRVTQSQRVVKVHGAGPLRLTRAPEGVARAALESGSKSVRFTGKRGVSGSLDLTTGAVTVDSTPGGSP
jgi:hypothetical protein